MNTEKLDRIEETLLEIRDMADSRTCFGNREGFAEKLRTLSALERKLSGDAESERDRELCSEIRGVIKASVCIFLPILDA